MAAIGKPAKLTKEQMPRAIEKVQDMHTWITRMLIAVLRADADTIFELRDSGIELMNYISGCGNRNG